MTEIETLDGAETMKPAQPLPTERPFLTFYTPTFRRPKALARCMESITNQTAAAQCEQIILPDHVGYGVAGGLFGRIPWYAEACRGEYVTIMADDDALMTERVVQLLMDFARKNANPPVLVVGSVKKGFQYPSCDPEGEPLCTQVDLGCYVLRRDIWVFYSQSYGRRYEGDYDHAHAMWSDGIPFKWTGIAFVEGDASNGRPER